MMSLLGLLPIVSPIFGLIGIGFIARISNLIGDRTGDGLSDYVFSIAVPCLIFKTLNATGIPTDQPWGYWCAYFGGTAIVWTIAMLLGRSLFNLSPSENVVAGFTGAQSNTVLVGVPLILQAYGDAGAIPLFLLIAVHLPIMFTTATLLEEGRKTHITVILRQLITHPILLAILFSASFHLSGWPIPSFLSSLIEAIAASALPCALIAMGIALKRYGVKGNSYLLWATVQPDTADNRFGRWDASVNGTSSDGSDDYRNAPNTYGWVVEVDPFRSEEHTSELQSH